LNIIKHKLIIEGEFLTKIDIIKNTDKLKKRIDGQWASDMCRR